MSEPIRWLAPPLGFVAPRSKAEEVPLPRPPSLEEIQAIEQAAYLEGLERGRSEGHAEGFAQGQQDVRRLAAQIEGILDNFSRPLDRLENEVVAALSELAVRIAGSLIGRAYQADPMLLSELASAALDTVGATSREVEVRMHPDDIAALTPVLSLMPATRLSADTSLSRGDLRVHAESVRIDGTLEARLRGTLETVLSRGAQP
ncbi:FliH/SctL family protein [Pseudoxanthomonas wuyuanensis]|uniref:Flagellar assembly protein FliH n=1 Tax=Pseudoxanthomonas wuyuanensis TaxID=1073196 RepID=A0A286CZY7_9GAMM|nr:FliH/SctL family protein [Pseudoxanthomonas wuyuanensis]KAF1722429.1 flagellar assembly protein FliH [Pseudoxanthomonas wuyuanensis]SOD51973.1 flagellar assembly protein FliH [Pseudoxanthomonas wuyuanensis]